MFLYTEIQTKLFPDNERAFKVTSELTSTMVKNRLRLLRLISIIVALLQNPSTPKAAKRFMVSGVKLSMFANFNFPVFTFFISVNNLK